jgi:ectoine hydroxylase-related dioxygenase (phytanoyl-CoA dioxygenase family)
MHLLREVGGPQLARALGKEGVLQVQPPAAVLEQLVAVRLHLDDCGPQDGPLRVLPGSHTAGVRPEGALASAEGAVVCTAPRGSALLMRPLLMHASSKANGHSLRRVLHLLFAPPALPLGLRWHHAV